MKNKNINSEGNKNFYVTLFSSIAVLAVIACSVAMFSRDTSETPDIVAENELSNNDLQPANQSDVKSYTDNTSTSEAQTEVSTSARPKSGAKPAVEDNTDTKKTKQPTAKPSQSSNSGGNTQFSLFDDTKYMSWPVSGQVIMDYSVETAVYDNTLDQYRTNDSICIAAPLGTEVRCATEGIVQSITNDSVRGNSVVINHGNGWLTTYNQLEDNPLVSEGEVVCENDIIGKVGEPSNYSVGLGPHLDFKISKDDVATDPKLVLAQLDE